MFKDFTEISYLPKYYDRADLEQKYQQIERCVKELRDCGKLKSSELEELADHCETIRYTKDTYSRNYTIRFIKTLQSYARSRT